MRFGFGLAQVVNRYPEPRAQLLHGDWPGDEDQRLALFEQVIPRVSAVDVELSSEILGRVAAATKAANRLLIVSYHDYLTTPDVYTLEHIVEDARKAGADVVKIATTVNTNEDMQSLAALCISNADRNLVVIGMGGVGLPTRLLFPALGSLMTFAFLGQPTAPGQLPFDQMFQLMRVFYPTFAEEKLATVPALASEGI